MPVTTDRYEDQVPRWFRFMEDHPEIGIASPEILNKPFWKAYLDGECIAIEIDLGHLLDALERWLERDQ